MILDEWVEVKISSQNIKHYSSKGYSSVIGETLRVAPLDLPSKSACKLRVQCDTCGIVQSIRASSYFKRKVKDTCKLCCTSTTKTLDFIREEFSKRGYVLKSNPYVNAHQHLEYVCEKHPDHIQRIIYNSLQRGSGCRFCALEHRSSLRSLTEEDIANEVLKTPYTLLDIMYNNARVSKSKLILYCSVHEQPFEIVYNNLQQGNGCPQCGRDRLKGKNNIFYKGTTMYLSQYLRSYLADWKLKWAKEANYKCILSNLTQDLTDFDIHHTVASKIIESEALIEVAGYADRHDTYTAEMLAELVPVYKLKHEDVVGAFIAHPIHKLFHKFYGNRDGSTTTQYEEFASDFKKGWIVFDSNDITYRKNGKSRYKLRRLNDQTKNSGEYQGTGVSRCTPT